MSATCVPKGALFRCSLYSGVSSDSEVSVRVRFCHGSPEAACCCFWTSVSLGSKVSIRFFHGSPGAACCCFWTTESLYLCAGMTCLQTEQVEQLANAFFGDAQPQVSTTGADGVLVICVVEPKHLKQYCMPIHS